MGYEIAGGLGVKMAAPERDVYVIVGDGSYLMLSSELVTSVQEGYKLIVILLDNHGFKSIGSLSRSLGQDGFGTRYAYPKDGMLPGDSAGEAVEPLAIDFAANARSLGAEVITCPATTILRRAAGGPQTDRTTLIYVQIDRYESVPGYESWWDVPVAEVSEMPAVQQARREWEEMRARERYFLE
jgi:3D-(3,5/4)-trihydroxycyclohexane-1,2-dione acylhydrolase (decyclizing)